MLLNLSKDGCILSKDICILSKDSFSASHPLGHGSLYKVKGYVVAVKLRTKAMMARKS